MAPLDIRQTSNDLNYYQREVSYWRERWTSDRDRREIAEDRLVDCHKQVDHLTQTLAAASRLIEELTNDRDFLAERVRTQWQWHEINPSPPVQTITEDQLLAMLGFPRSNE